MASAAPQEKVFRSYTNEQGANYAHHRRGYHPDIYKLILDHHVSTGGRLDTVLDIGCGPGTAVRELAPRFTHAIGLDPSEGMINTARSMGGASSTGEPIRFELATAEDLGSQLSPPVADGSVDLIAAATAAHWFDMGGFWPAAARVLRPGGTVALWSGSKASVHPSLPGREGIQAALEKLEAAVAPYEEPAHQLVKDLYVDLQMPWTVEPAVVEFDRASLFRRLWNPDGEPDERGEFFMGQHEADLDTMEKMVGTASPVTRWREAHPADAGTEQDVVRIMRREMEKALHEAGVEKGKELIKGGVAGVLLMVKKKAQ